MNPQWVGSIVLIVQLYFDIENEAGEVEQAKRIQKFQPITAR